MASGVKGVQETSLESNFYYPLSDYDLIDPVNYGIKTEFYYLFSLMLVIIDSE